jgi:hypothetical protein
MQYDHHGSARIRAAMCSKSRDREGRGRGRGGTRAVARHLLEIPTSESKQDSNGAIV